MKWLLRPSLNSFIIVFIDVILVYYKNEGGNICHLRTVLQKLREKKLHAKIFIYEFWLESVGFFGNVVTKEGIMFHPAKVAAVHDLVIPAFAIEIRSSIGLVGYYHRFIQRFSSIVVPLTKFTLKTVGF